MLFAGMVAHLGVLCTGDTLYLAYRDLWGLRGGRMQLTRLRSNRFFSGQNEGWPSGECSKTGVSRVDPSCERPPLINTSFLPYRSSEPVGQVTNADSVRSVPETKHQTSRIPEIILVGVGELIRKMGKEIIKLRWPE